MKHDGSCYLALAALAAWALAPAWSQARQNLHVELPEGAGSCADLQVHSSGRVAQAAEAFALPRNQVSVLQVENPDGQIHARGWDRAEYSLEACRIVAAQTQGDADRLLNEVAVSRAGSRFSATGPAGEAAAWQVVFILHAPTDAALDLETRNGPMDARAIDGALKARAANGPISIRDCSGSVEVHTDNGPISWRGGGGDVQLSANNGPISLRLSTEDWNGPRLEARTTNGPLSALLPETFRSGVRAETDSYAPLSCRLSACSGLRPTETGNRRVLAFNGASATVRLSTGNGPLSIAAAGNSERVSSRFYPQPIK
jgi:hypothetical protein